MYAEALFYRLQLSSSPTTNNKAVTTTAARTMTIQQQPDACSIADKPSFFLNSLLLSLSPPQDYRRVSCLLINKGRGRAFNWFAQVGKDVFDEF